MPCAHLVQSATFPGSMCASVQVIHAMQIFFGGKHIGGADELASLKSNGKLTSILNEQKGETELPHKLASALAHAQADKQVGPACPASTHSVALHDALILWLANPMSYIVPLATSEIMGHECIQVSSRSAAPAGTPLEEYRELRGLADSLRDQHLAGSDARSRWLSEQCSACQDISQNAHHDGSSMKCGLHYCIATWSSLAGLQ